MLYEFKNILCCATLITFPSITCYEDDHASTLAFLSFYWLCMSITYSSEYHITRMVFACLGKFLSVSSLKSLELFLMLYSVSTIYWSGSYWSYSVCDVLTLFVIDSLNAIFSALPKYSSGRFVELGWTILLITYDHSLTQTFSWILFCDLFWIMPRVRKTPSSKSIVPIISISITWTMFLLYLLLVRSPKRSDHYS